MKIACLIIALLLIPHISISLDENVYASKNFNLYDASRNRNIPTTVYYPINGGNFPVIIVSHGGGGNKSSLITHVKHLVSNSYVVIIPEHVGSDTEYLRHLLEKGYSFKEALEEMAGNKTEWENRPKDISFVIDMAYIWNESDEDLKGKMDLSKIGILGHSYGAYTVMAVMGALVKMPYGIASFEDNRIKAGVAISPQGAGGNPKIDRVNDYFFNGSWKNITRPISFFAESDELVDWRMEPFNEITFEDVYFLRFIMTRHTDFSDWRKTLRSEETRNVSKALALRFFDVYLKGYDKSSYNEEYADSLCKRNKIVIDIIWRDKLKEDFMIYIKKPLEGYLYLFDKIIMPLRNTIIIGRISIEVSFNEIEKIEFYIDNKLKFVDELPPYQWIWNEFSIGKHEIKVIAYKNEKSAYDELEVIAFIL